MKRSSQFLLALAFTVITLLALNIESKPVIRDMPKDISHSDPCDISDNKDAPYCRSITYSF